MRAHYRETREALNDELVLLHPRILHHRPEPEHVGCGYGDCGTPDPSEDGDGTKYAGICNTDEPIPDGYYVAFAGACTKYNQDDALLAGVAGLRELGEAHGVGELRVHTVQLYDERGTDFCGDMMPEAADGEDRLRALAEVGGGAFFGAGMTASWADLCGA